MEERNPEQAKIRIEKKKNSHNIWLYLHNSPEGNILRMAKPPLKDIGYKIL